jgi:hypothetical protein
MRRERLLHPEIGLDATKAVGLSLSERWGGDFLLDIPSPKTFFQA